MPGYKLPNPELRYLIDSDEYQTLSQYGTPEIVVPAGFVTDGNSAPWWIRWLFPRYDRSLPACIVHDYCYGGTMGRKTADRLLFTNMKRLGFPVWKAGLMYLGVRIGGHARYDYRQRKAS
jgi:hypothetical protein